MCNTNFFITDIETESINNKFYRKVLYTSNHQQLVLMSIKPKQKICYEIHKNNDQFIRIEKGHGIIVIGPKKECKFDLYPGVSVTVPQGTWHEIINTSDVEDLQLYTIYSPPHHPKNKIDMDGPATCNGNNNHHDHNNHSGYNNRNNRNKS